MTVPKSIDVVLVCPVHGRDQKPFEIGGTKFCAACLESYFRRFQAGHVRVLEMRTVEKEYGEKDDDGA